MKPLQQNDLYQNLSSFLKSRGIELTQGSYSQAIQKSCSLLTDAINLGQRGFDKAKVEVDAKLDQMRQVIHEKTAPKRPAASTPPPPPPPPPPAPAPTGKAPPKISTRKSRKVAKPSRGRSRRGNKGRS